MWIDSEYGQSIGEIGYLVETFNTNNGRTTFSLRDRPLRTNQSHEPRRVPRTGRLPLPYPNGRLSWHDL